MVYQSLLIANSKITFSPSNSWTIDHAWNLTWNVNFLFHFNVRLLRDFHSGICLDHLFLWSTSLLTEEKFLNRKTLLLSRTIVKRRRRGGKDKKGTLPNLERRVRYSLNSEFLLQIMYPRTSLKTDKVQMDLQVEPEWFFCRPILRRYNRRVDLLPGFA